MELKEIIIDWHREAFGNPFAASIFFHVDNNTLYLVTRFPGICIGYHGTLVDKYKLILQENGYNFDIKFVDFFKNGVTEF